MKLTKANAKEPLKYWKTWLALIIIVLATFSGFYVIWSLLFLLWIIISIKNQEIYLVERVNAKTAPITFWVANISWFVVSLYIVWEFLVLTGRIG